MREYFAGSRSTRFVLFLALVITRTTGAQTPDAHQLYALAKIRRECIDFKDLERGSDSWQIRDCRVSDFGQFGTVSGKTYYYATYCIIPNSDVGTCGDTTFTALYHKQRGLAIFAKPLQRKTAALLFERVSSEIGIYRYDIKPEIIRNRFGTILYVPIVVDGTGAVTAAERRV